MNIFFLTPTHQPLIVQVLCFSLIWEILIYSFPNISLPNITNPWRLLLSPRISKKLRAPEPFFLLCSRERWTLHADCIHKTTDLDASEDLKLSWKPERVHWVELHRTWKDLGCLGLSPHSSRTWAAWRQSLDSQKEAAGLQSTFGTSLLCLLL